MLLLPSLSSLLVHFSIQLLFIVVTAFIIHHHLLLLNYHHLLLLVHHHLLLLLVIVPLLLLLLPLLLLLLLDQIFRLHFVRISQGITLQTILVSTIMIFSLISHLGISVVFLMIFSSLSDSYCNSLQQLFDSFHYYLSSFNS